MDLRKKCLFFNNYIYVFIYSLTHIFSISYMFLLCFMFSSSMNTGCCSEQL